MIRQYLVGAVLLLAASTASAAPLYTALGASDAVGYGATSPNSQDPSLPNNGYVYRIIVWLRSRQPQWALDNRGISGASAPGIVAGELNGAVADQPPLVTLWAGGNDVKDSVLQQEPTSTLAARFQTAFTTLIQRLRQETTAYVVACNLPDMSKLPVGQYLVEPYKTLAHNDSVALNDIIASVCAQYGVPVIDLYSDPRSTDPNNISSADGFHPNDNGYAILAQKIEAQILGDVDGDGKLAAGDTVLALRIAGGAALPNDRQRIAADTYPPGGDGRIGLSDAVQILRRAAGLVPDTDWR